MKCFKTSGIFDAIPISNKDQTQQQQEPNEFDHWFADLLEVTWDEYLAFDNQLESETPYSAPTPMSIEHTENEQVDDDIDEVQPNLTIDNTTDQLM